ncbi:hypothetical protein MK489_24500 [Myxococcota bacterium]|nr:hypothetical protein [Myxococcota bacterium]
MPESDAANRRDSRAMAALMGLALLLYVGLAAAASSTAGIDLTHLAVYFDGNLYIEIAKSFPTPYSPAGPDYLGHAPGYPALIAGVHALTPSAWVDWGLAALIASWLPAALATGAFYRLCQQLSLPPLWPTLAFTLCNPRWLAVASTAHAENLAMFCVLTSVISHLRHRPITSMLWLSLAGLTRFPALLVGPALAFGILATQRDWRRGTLLALTVPSAAFLLLHLYLRQRVPGFETVMDSHQVFWVKQWTWPFASLWKSAIPWWNSEDHLYFGITYTTLVVQLVAFAWGWRAPREQWVLPLWIAGVVILPACFSGSPAAWDYSRLTLLAWPPTLLILWRALAHKLNAPVVLLACVVMGLYGASVSQRAIRGAVEWQNQILPYLQETIRRLDDHSPRWIRFGVRPEKRRPDSSSTR